MQEIEVKAVLREPASVQARLETLGCAFSAPVLQEDAVYVEKSGDLQTFLANKVFLRIRVRSDGKILFTAKRRTGALVAIEHEVAVDSKEELEAMLAHMGFTKAVEIRKTRLTARHGPYEICLDDVAGLGRFIEMERLSPDADAKAVQEEMFALLESFGVGPNDRVTEGYEILTLRKKLV